MLGAIFFVLGLSSYASAQTEFKTKWNVATAGESGAGSLSLPLLASGTYACTIDWVSTYLLYYLKLYSV